MKGLRNLEAWEGNNMIDKIIYLLKDRFGKKLIALVVFGIDD